MMTLVRHAADADAWPAAMLARKRALRDLAACEARRATDPHQRELHALRARILSLEIAAGEGAR